jgi:hypothetical protein
MINPLVVESLTVNNTTRRRNDSANIEGLTSTARGGITC